MDHIEKRIKPPHPREKANIASLLSFFYILPMFRKGTKRNINEEDLYEVLPSYEAKRLGDKLGNQYKKTNNEKRKISILRLVLACFGREILTLGIIEFLAGFAIIVIQPYATGKVISYFNPGQKELSKTDLYMYTALLIAINLSGCFYYHNFRLLIMGLGIKIRTAFSSLIYRKALSLNPTHLGSVSIGRIITLISKDVACLEYFSFLINDIWIALIKIAIVCYMLYRRIKVAAFAGIGFFLVVYPIQCYMGTWAAILRTRMCKKVDERLQTTQEALSAIKIIKMYTWQKIFIRRIMKARKKEIQSWHAILYLKLIILQIGALSTNVAFYLLIMTYKWLGNHLTADTVYYIDSCLQTSSYALSVQFPSCISLLAEVVASIRRVIDFLELPEPASREDYKSCKPKIIFNNVNIELQGEEILHCVSLKIERGITLVAGPVGSGKTFLLKTILQEYQISSGSIAVEGIISFASQEPWLFPSSIKQNILFGEKYIDDRYRRVIKVCALEYDLDLLPEQDNTIVEDRGINLSKGQQARINLARAVYKESDIYLLDNCLSALDNHVSNYIYEECIRKFLTGKIVIFVSHNLRYLKNADNIIMVKNGKVTTDDAFGKTLKIEESDDGIETNAKYEPTLATTKTVYGEVRKEGIVDFQAYKKYLLAAGGIISLVAIISIYGASQFLMSYPDKLLSQWVDIEQKISNYTFYNNTNTSEESLEDTIISRDSILKTYTIMIILSTFVNIGGLFIFYRIVRKASINLYKKMITSIIYASMHFFDNTFIGNVLNRFSIDFTVIDDHLPFMFNHTIRVFFITIGIMILIATVNTSFLIPSFIFFGILILTRKYYLKTSRSLKRLSVSTRSPVVGYLNSSLEGLSTIKAFNAEDTLTQEFDSHQNLYTSADFTFHCVMKAFGLCLDVLSNTFVIIIIARFVFSNEEFSAGSVGLALSQAIRMSSTLQWGVRMWAEMENSMTSVERVLEYAEVQQESIKGDTLENWPVKGEIQYSNVCLSYNDSDDTVLKNINFNISSGEKVGIVGRTGAGKSSIISTLFRLYEVKGSITIDGVDTKSLSLDFLRKQICIIPQDPVVFTGTIRDNIDPEKIHTDDQIWKAIETANLRKFVPSLEYEIVEDGSNFSMGQKQLISLARAIVRNNKIVVLDELTANMDDDMDALIHETINKQFENCTLIMIAHKLHSVIGLDKIIVMENGRISDFDSPENLLQKGNGYFYNILKHSELMP